MTQFKKKVVQVDMDGVLCDWEGAFYGGRKQRPQCPYPQSMPGFFVNLKLMHRAISSMKLLSICFDIRICTAPSNKNPSASEKI